MRATSFPSARNLVIVGAVGSALAAAVAVIGFPSGSPDLREGVVPWVFALLIVAVGMIVWGTVSTEIGVPTRLAGVSSRLSIVGVVVAAGFFLTMGSLNLVGVDVPSGESLIVGVGTLVGSIGCLVILPAGLISFCVVVLSDRRLLMAARCLPVLAVLSGGLVFVDDSLRAFVTVSALCWAAFAAVVARNAREPL